jgi:hypothetical protein
MGLRREAAKFGLGTNDTCSRCGKQGGTKLDRRAVEELFRNFYCYGSQAAIYLPRVFTEGGNEDDDIQLEQSAQTDYELLKQLSGLTLRRHTPHVYEMGFTEIRSEIDEVLGQDPSSASEETAARLRQNLRRLLEAGFEYEMQDGERIYRARISPAEPTEPTEYDSPPSEKAIPNRIAVAGDRIFCGAFNIETCLIEIKPHIDDLIHHKIFVAALKSNGTLKLIDFTGRTEKPRLPELEFTLQAFFQANQNSYHLTQLLSHFVRRQGYDGIVYPSAMECTARDKGTWKNVALFGAPVTEKKLIIESINRVLIRSVANSFDLGPAWDDNTMGNHLAPYLKGWVKRARAPYKPI